MDKDYISKERIAKHGEVFTSQRDVIAMCDLVKNETERIDSRFLEPACGTGNFLMEVLSRKLAIVRNKYKKSISDWEQNSILALSSVYGIDILQDDVDSCIENLFSLWNHDYIRIAKKNIDENVQKSAKAILVRNIVCGDSLTMLKNDGTPIVFSEWAFIKMGLLQRRDFLFKTLTGDETDDCIEDNVFLKQETMNYRRVWEHVN